MDLREQPDGSLLLTYDSSRWATWLIGATIVMPGTLTLTEPRPRVDRMRG